MKKNLFVSMLAMASMLFATSCSQDELLNEPSTGDYVNAKFTVSTPEGIGTRAAVNVGKGTTVNYVACAVYDSKGTEMTDLRQYVEIKEKKAEYSIRLVKGQAYRVAFFAYYDGDNKADGSNRYYDLTDMTNIVIKDAVSNREGRDAFTNYVDVTADESMKAIEKSVTLYRPFAQLNLGAVKEDIDAAAKAGVVVTLSKITVSNVFTAFDAYNNEVAANAQPTQVVFDLYDIPGEKLYVDMDKDATTPDESFEYLALNYLLVGNANSEKELTDVTFEWKTADDKTNSPATVFKNIPVQRNYRTNIIGCLLTNPAKFNIVIDEQFKKPDYIIDAPWDGTSEKEPEKDADGTYVVKSAAELVWMANQPTTDINSDPYFKNIKLASDIDLNGNEINAITFKGTFDGQNHTISNLVLVSNDSPDDGASLFGVRTMGTIKNLKIKNATADVSADEDGWAAAILAGITDQGNVTLENVHVYNSDLKGVMGVGGLVGAQLAANVKLTLNNCSVNDTKVWNYAVEDESGHVAGLVGRVSGTLTIGENVASNNVEVVGIWSAKRQEGSIDAIASTDLKNGTGTINGIENATVTGGKVTKYEMKEGLHYIGSGKELASLAKSASGSVNISLISDIDMTGIKYTPFNVSTINFNGNSFTISGVVVENNEGASMFGNADNFNISNLTIKESKFVGINNAADNSEDAVGALLGFVEAHSSTDHKITNCHVFDCTIGSGKYVGGLVGYKNGNNSIDFENCSVKESRIVSTLWDEDKYKGHAGGLIGIVNACSVTNCVVVENDFTGALGDRIGLFFGTTQQDFKPTGSVSGNKGCTSLCGTNNKITDTTGVEGL